MKSYLSTCKTQYWYNVYNDLAGKIRYLQVLSAAGDRYGGGLIQCSGYLSSQDTPIKNFYYMWDIENYEPMKKGINNGFYSKLCTVIYTGNNIWPIPIWQDRDGGRNGVYDAGIDVIVYAGYPENALQDGDKGYSNGSIYYYDRNSNGLWDSTEEVWEDSVCKIEIPVLAAGLSDAIYALCETSYVDPNFQSGDFSGIGSESIPYLLKVDADGNYAPLSRIKLFERDGEDAYLFTIIPSHLSDGTKITDNPVYGRFDWYSLPKNIFPVFFEEVRSLLNRNIFKSAWLSESETGAAWSSNGENNGKYGVGQGSSMSAAFASALAQYNSSSYQVSYPYACIGYEKVSNKYYCTLIRYYAYLGIGPNSLLRKTGLPPFQTDFYVFATSPGKFNGNGEGVQCDKWSRFGQEPQGTDINVNRKLGSFDAPAYTGNLPGNYEGYSVTMGAILMNYNIEFNIASFETGMNSSKDTNLDDLFDVGVDLHSIENETGTIFHLPDTDEPQVILPLRWNVTYTDTLQYPEYIAAGGIKNQRIEELPGYSTPFIQAYQAVSSQRLDDLNVPLFRSSMTFLFNDVYINMADDDPEDNIDKSIHIKRVALVRPKGQVVVFDFPWDSSVNKFKDVGVPTGIHSGRTYRLVSNIKPYASPEGRYYSLHFDSGIVHNFSFYYVTSENNGPRFFTGLSQASKSRDCIWNAADRWNNIDMIDASKISPYPIQGFHYDVTCEWNGDGLLSKLFYRTKNGTETIEVSLEYDANRKIARMTKKVPPSLAINGMTTCEISVNGNTITYPDGSTSVRSIESEGSSNVAISRTIPGAGTVTNVYEYGANELVSKIRTSANNDEKATGFSYHSGNAEYTNTSKLTQKLKSIIYPDGSWKYFEYDSNGWLSKAYSPFKNEPFPSSESGPVPGNCRIEEYQYVSHDTRDVVDSRKIWEFPRTRISYVKNIETSRTLFSEYSGETVQQSCSIPGAQWNDQSNLRISGKFSNGSSSGLGIFVFESVNPSEKTQRLNWVDGNLNTDCKLYGAVINPKITDSRISFKDRRTDIRNTYQTYSQEGTALYKIETIRNSRGTEYSRKVNDSSSGELVSSAVSETDAFGRITKTTYLDGSTEEFNAYSMHGPQIYKDRTGNVFIYEYYPNGQVQSVSSPTGTTSFMYDAIGNTETSITTPFDGNVIVRTSLHDALGRVIESSDDFGTARHQYSGSSVSTSYPDGTDESIICNLDGTTASIGGTAVHPVEYDYGTGADGYWMRSGTPGGPSTTAYFNMLGQAWKTKTSSGYEQTTIFDSKGRPSVVADGQHSRSISYNSKNEVSQVMEDGVTTTNENSTGSGKYTTTATTSKDSETFTRKSEVLFTGLESWETVNGRTMHTLTEFLGNGSVRTTVKDPAEKVLTSTSAPLSTGFTLSKDSSIFASASNTFDGAGRVRKSTSREGTAEFDYWGGTAQPSSIKSPDNRTTSFAHSPGNFNPTSITTPY
ncbi:MAG TPA: hypothetical protein DET40_24685 [Lentisphaeria bacterium]|nr:MAG: hypothetical protein A2X45_01320 [Lentisphaerae bacterium GWF2_50_93]HCE46757.1 hypothetical protein [Lentisphaeria bacterium]